MDNKDRVLQVCLANPTKKPGRHWVAEETGLAPATVGRWLSILRSEGALADRDPGDPTNDVDPPEIEHPLLPDELPTADELLARRRKQFDRKHASKDARRLIPVKVHKDGPIGILHMGDPHIDDDGTDIHALERDVRLICDTDGLYGANVGDNQNNWPGRLARLYGKQSVTQAEAWVLVEWLITTVGDKWMYLCAGNHDLFKVDTPRSPGDPLQWMVRQHNTAYQEHGVRIGLQLRDGREVRINCRHDHKGRSQWNPNHGPSKAAKMGWKDHIVIAGHTHESGGPDPLKDQMTKTICWSAKVAGYKVYDDYADQNGFPDQNINPSIISIIDTNRDETHPGFIKWFWDVDAGADYLTWLRSK